MQPDRGGENHLFQVLPLQYQVLNCIAVGNAGNILFDNRALIEFSRHIVAGCSNNFHPPGVGLMVGLGADKRGVERSGEY